MLAANVALAIGLIFLLALAGVLFAGAPYLPSHQRAIRAMLALTQPRPGQRMADLGAGDGRVVAAFARRGVRACGYELNPLLVAIGRLWLRRVGLSNQASLEVGSLWRVDCRAFDIIVVFGLDRYQFMAKLEKKLRAELRPGAVVVSNAFQFPHWPASAQAAGVFLYRQPTVGGSSVRSSR